MRSRFMTPLFAVTLVCLGAVACSNNNSGGSTPTSPTCTVTAASAGSTFAAAGGTGSVTVTAGAGCAWTATSGASFVTITSGASGSGNGTVNYTVSANTGAARTATLTVGGTGFTISQSAAATPPPPTGTLGAPTANAPVGGAAVTTGNPTLIVNNAAATGNVGTVTYRFEVSDLPTFPSDPVRTFTVDGVAQGSGTTSWTVTRTLGNDVLWYWHARATNGTVTSDYSPTETFRTPSSCTVTVPASLSAASTASVANLAVSTSTSTCAWTAQSNVSWITITSGASGSGSGTIGISIAANTTGAARTGTITVNNQTVMVTQAASGGGSGAIVASFTMRQPAISGSSPVTDCRIEAGTGLNGSTCILDSTSFPTGTNGLVKFDWSVTFFDGGTQTFTQSGANTSLPFTWKCGGPSSADPPGATQPLSVTLTVTDSAGNTATATSGSGGQPSLTITLNKC